MGELGPRRNRIPEPQCCFARRRVDQYRAKERVVAEEQCGYAVTASVHNPGVVRLDLVVGGLVGDGLVDDVGVES